jgi:hypothetical protein
LDLQGCFCRITSCPYSSFVVIRNGACEVGGSQGEWWSCVLWQRIRNFLPLKRIHVLILCSCN